MSNILIDNVAVCLFGGAIGDALGAPAGMDVTNQPSQPCRTRPHCPRYGATGTQFTKTAFHESAKTAGDV